MNTNGGSVAQVAQDVAAVAQRVLALSTREPGKAMSLARRALRSPRPAEPAARARLLRAYGHALRAAGDYAGARSVYLRARRIYRAQGQESERAVCALGLIDTCMYLGRTRQGLEVAAEARRVFVATGDKQRLAKLETNVGNLYHHIDAIEPALTHYERAATLFANQGASLERASVDHNRANILAYLGRRSEAERLYRGAKVAFEAAGEPVLTAQTRYGLACLEFLSGEYAAAIAELEAVRPELSRLGARPLLALADVDLAEVLVAMKLYPEALSLSRSASRWFRARGVRAEHARCELVAGLALARLGRSSEALRAFEVADRLFLHQKHVPGRSSVALARAQLLLSGGAPRRAAVLALQARASFERAGFGLRGLAASALAAEAWLAADRPERASGLATALLRSPRLPGDGYTRARLARVQGASAAQLGRTRTALRCYEQAIEEARGAYASIFVDEWRVGFVEGEPAILDEALGVLLADRPRPKPQQVWRWIRRAAGVPREAASEAHDAVASPAVSRRVDDLRADLEACYARLWRMRSGPTRHAHLDATRRLERRALHLEGALRRLGRPEGHGRNEKSSPGEMPPTLTPGETYVTYFSSGGWLGALRLDEGGWALIPQLAPTAEVARQLRLFHYQMEARSSGVPLLVDRRDMIVHRADDHLAALGRVVLDPVLPAGPAPRVLTIAAHGPLHRLPFHALPWGGQPLAERCEVGFALPEPAPSPGTERRGACVLAFGDGPGVIEREAEQIAALLREGGVAADHYTGPSATRDRLRCAAGRVALIHVAGHAVYRAEHPEFSALRVSDGWINASDLAALPLDGTCVVLSACETGARGVAAGDEVLGLVRGAVRGGAAAIVTSLWRVDDAATATFMADLYRRWREVGPLGTAFREVQMRLGRETADPYLWAGFCLMGDRRFPWPVAVPEKR